MADPKDPLAELDSALDEMDLNEADGSQDLQEEQTQVDPQNTEEAKEIELGGRKWKSYEEADKSWKSLQADHTKKSQLLAESDKKFKAFQEEHKQAIELAKFFNENPDITTEVFQFLQKKTEGQTDKQAKMGLSVDAKSVVEQMKKDPTFKDLLTTQEAWKQRMLEEQHAREDAVLDKEIDDLKKEYKLDDDKMNQVIAQAQKFNANVKEEDDYIPLKDVYLFMSSKHAWRKAAKVQDIALPTPTSEGVSVRPDPKRRDPESELLSGLDKLGIPD